jgi:hypothetical protein
MPLSFPDRCLLDGDFGGTGFSLALAGAMKKVVVGLFPTADRAVKGKSVTGYPATRRWPVDRALMRGAAWVRVSSHRIAQIASTRQFKQTHYQKSTPVLIFEQAKACATPTTES